MPAGGVGYTATSPGPIYVQCWLVRSLAELGRLLTPLLPSQRRFGAPSVHNMPLPLAWRTSQRAGTFLQWAIGPEPVPISNAERRNTAGEITYFLFPMRWHRPPGFLPKSERPTRLGAACAKVKNSWSARTPVKPSTRLGWTTNGWDAPPLCSAGSTMPTGWPVFRFSILHRIRVSPQAATAPGLLLVRRVAVLRLQFAAGQRRAAFAIATAERGIHIRSAQAVFLHHCPKLLHPRLFGSLEGLSLGFQFLELPFDERHLFRIGLRQRT